MKSLASFAVASILVLAGCTSTHVLVGTKRPPISPDQVRIYLDPPPVFEKVAVLSANSNAAFAITSQGRTNVVVERLKAEAAALGANGILFGGIKDQYAGSIGSGNAWVSGNAAWGIGVATPVYQKVGEGIAIYVPPGTENAPPQPAPQQQPPPAEMKWRPPKDW